MVTLAHSDKKQHRNTWFFFSKALLLIKEVNLNQNLVGTGTLFNPWLMCIKLTHVKTSIELCSVDLTWQTMCSPNTLKLISYFQMGGRSQTGCGKGRLSELAASPGFLLVPWLTFGACHRLSRSCEGPKATKEHEKAISLLSLSLSRPCQQMVFYFWSN